MKELVNLLISVSDQIFKISVQMQAKCPVIPSIRCIYYVFVSFEKSIVEKVKNFHPLQGHFHDHFYFKPKLTDELRYLVLALLAIEKHPPKDDSPDLPGQLVLFRLILTLSEQPLRSFPYSLPPLLQQKQKGRLPLLDECGQFDEVKLQSNVGSLSELGPFLHILYY